MDVTPRDAASRSAGRIRSSHSSSEIAASMRSRRNSQADSSRRTPVGSPRLVRLDHAAGDAQVAVREREGGRVEPERVAVARDQRDRRVRSDRVEVVLRRLDRGRPVAAPPAATADPGAARCAEPPPRLRARPPPPASPCPLSLISFCASDQSKKWTCESVNPGRTQRPPRSMRSGLASADLVRADAARDPLARDRERRRLRQRRAPSCARPRSRGSHPDPTQQGSERQANPRYHAAREEAAPSFSPRCLRPWSPRVRTRSRTDSTTVTAIRTSARCFA